MNTTIEKIVNLLFEDLAETEETIAIREEILQNCQERYQDLREAGISEDDAIHAVIESLNGMEEMLSDYPRKADEPVNVPEPPATEDAEAADEEEACAWSCDPALSPIREIRMEHMSSADVIVCASRDHLIHVECSEPKLTLMTGIENGVLTIALSEQKQEKVKEEIKFSLEDGFDLSSLGKLFEKLAKRFVSVNNSIDAEITLEIPAAICPDVRISTTSGNVTAEPLMLERMQINTVSGDVEMDALTCRTLTITTTSGHLALDNLDVKEHLLLTSVSGDMEMDASRADTLKIHTTSGDIVTHRCNIASSASVKTTSGDAEWMNSVPELSVVSLSGDLHLSGALQNVHFSTISGDVQVMAEESGLQMIKGTTTSGDCAVRLPENLEAAISCRSRSGDIRIQHASFPESPVKVDLSSVSGDIRVR